MVLVTLMIQHKIEVGGGGFYRKYILELGTDLIGIEYSEDKIMMEKTTK